VTTVDFYAAFNKPDRPTPQPLRAVPAGDAQPYAAAALAREAQTVATAANGTRNHTLNTAAYNLGQLVAAGHLDRAVVEHELSAAAHAAGLDPAETRNTIRSGLNGAADSPRHPPPRQDTPTWPAKTSDPFASHTSSASGTGTRGAGTAASAAASTSPASPMATHGPSQTPAHGATRPDPDPTADDAALVAANAERARLYRLGEEVERQRAQRAARRLLDAEDAAASFRAPPWRSTLTDELNIPDEPVAYSVDKVLPTGGNVLLTAQFKAGKTTLVNQLARSLADRSPFLGRFDVHAGGRIALWNYEVDDRQYRRWLRDVGIRDTDRVTLLNLRGYRVPVTVDYVEDWVVKWLQDHEIETWVVDPFARAFTGNGKSENDNTEVGAFLDTLDVIKNRAGVSDLILPTHTGRAEFEAGEERARGATRLDDWADVRWFLTKDDDDVRYFRAMGRDVDVPEEKLTFDEHSRSLILGGGDRAWERRRRLEDAVVRAVQEQPGLTLRTLRPAVRDAGGKGRNDVIDEAVDGAVRGRRIVESERPGKGGGHLYYPAGTMIGNVS
jgi:hypothetical protein